MPLTPEPQTITDDDPARLDPHDDGDLYDDGLVHIVNNTRWRLSRLKLARVRTRCGAYLVRAQEHPEKVGEGTERIGDAAAYCPDCVRP